MTARTIVCYGDSNTYGYDPADWTTLRYPHDQRWTSLLQKALGADWRVLPEGLNGRCLPDLRYEGPWLRGLVQPLGPEDLFALMLGTNDLLMSWQPSARAAAERMEQLLRFLTLEAGLAPRNVLVIAPPHISAGQSMAPPNPRLTEESARMNDAFRVLAQRYHTRFIDAGKWDIDLCRADQVHFSELGHRQFAQHMTRLLKTI